MKVPDSNVRGLNTKNLIVVYLLYIHTSVVLLYLKADPGGSTVYDVGLPLGIAGIAGSNPSNGHGCLSFEYVLCCVGRVQLKCDGTR